jgi:hypothetical protein
LLDLQNEFPDSVLYVDEHILQHFTTPEAEARAEWYGVLGAPWLFFDGSREIFGSTQHCDEDYAEYDQLVRSMLERGGGMSPIAIDGEFTIEGDTASFSAEFMLVEPAEVGIVRAAFFIYEDDITYCCDAVHDDHWDRICRLIEYRTVTGLNQAGDRVRVEAERQLDPSWNPANLHAVVILEHEDDPKGILQASRLPAHGIDFMLSVPKRTASVPGGNGEAVFDASLCNLSASEDDFTISVEEAGGWPAEFQVQGDPDWHTNSGLTLEGGQSAALAVRARTDGERRVGAVAFCVRSESSGRGQEVRLTVMNGSPGILFVDDDGGHGFNGEDYDWPFTDALDRLGYLYTTWDVFHDHAGSGPSFLDENGYDAVIWQTGLEWDGILDPADRAGLVEYLDGGGNLYLNSMRFLETAGEGDVFTNDDLGVSSWTPAVHASTQYGVPGDPITSDLVLPVSWPYATWDRVPEVDPGPGASVVFLNEAGRPIALRHAIPSGGRVVFTTVPDFVLSQSAPDPNNTRILTWRVLDWLLQSGSAGLTGDAAGTAYGPELRVDPNPFSSGTRLRFRIPPGASAPVLLTVLDAAGREVRTLVDHALPAGDRVTIAWDGRDDSGRRLPAGLYLVRLRAAGREWSTKAVFLP